MESFNRKLMIGIGFVLLLLLALAAFAIWNMPEQLFDPFGGWPGRVFAVVLSAVPMIFLASLLYRMLRFPHPGFVILTFMAFCFSLAGVCGVGMLITVRFNVGEVTSVELRRGEEGLSLLGLVVVALAVALYLLRLYIRLWESERLQTGNDAESSPRNPVLDDLETPQSE